jgi:predicted acylesterase/phospholipase RssA
MKILLTKFITYVKNKLLEVIFNKNIYINKMKPEVLCLAGGGLKTIISVGALDYLESKDLLSNIKIFIGSSAGAFISYLLCIGYKPKEIYDIMYDKKIELNYLSLLNNIYICKVNVLLEVIKELTLKKFNKIITLKEIYELTGNKFMCTTFSLKYNKVVLLCDFYDPNLSILDAIKMTINIPILFEPIIYDSSYCVDSGIVSNFPINDFKTTKFILGINIITQNNNKINNIIDYFFYIFNSISKFLNDTNDINTNKFIINLKCPNISFLHIEFNKRNKLFNLGKLQCSKQIEEKYNIYISNLEKNINIDNNYLEQKLDQVFNSTQINFILYCIENNPDLLSLCLKKHKHLFPLSLLSNIVENEYNNYILYDKNSIIWK